jgi:alkylated DNA repair dioxygenase AlkB
MFVKGDAVLVDYPSSDKYYHGKYPAFYVKQYGNGTSRVLWEDSPLNKKFILTTTIVSNMYMEKDTNRHGANEEHIDKYFTPRKTSSNRDLSASDSCSSSSEEDEVEETEITTPLKRAKRQAYTMARKKIRKSVAKILSVNGSSKGNKKVVSKTTEHANAIATDQLRKQREMQKEIDKQYNLDIEAAVCQVCYGETVKSSHMCNNLLICEYASDTTPQQYCTNAMHIYCMHRSLPDDFDMEETKWFCPTHREANDDDKILHVKCEIVNNEKIYKKWKDGSDWTNLSNDEYKLYCQENKHLLITSSAVGITTTIQETKLNNNVLQKKYLFFKSNTYFGITQYMNYFDNQYLSTLESYVDNLFSTMFHEQQNTNSQALSYLEKTLDTRACKMLKRKKIFLGYRYSYGHSKKQSNKEVLGVYNDVDPIHKYTLIADLVDKVKNMPCFHDKTFNPNQVVINLYEEKGARLGAHVDNKFLFRRPIVSLRLFSDATLMFGVRGLGINTTNVTVKVPQKRGEVSLMENFAANNFNHGINKKSINRKSISILIREVTPEAIAAMKIRNREMGQRCALEAMQHAVYRQRIREEAVSIAQHGNKAGIQNNIVRIV